VQGGTGTVVGSTTARVAGPDITTEYYAAADEDPNGWVYVGGTSDLFRVPKAGGAAQDVADLANLTSSHLGYSMLVDGSNIYTLENDTTPGTTGHLFRISTDGGATWARQDWARFPTAPLDGLKGITSYGGRIYLVTNTPDDELTEVWSVDATAATQPTATLELTFTGEGNCNAVVRDTAYFYMACAANEALIRIPVAGGTPTIITNRFDMISTAGALHGDDLDADGVLDVLYLQAWHEEVNYVCDPDSATPFADVHTFFGSESSNYGMGFDGASNVLWVFDDDTDEIVSVR